MTMLNRATPDASPGLALTAADIRLLDKLVPDKTQQIKGRSISHYINKIVKLGGYLACSNDPQPGNIVIWRGLSRLAAAVLGAEAIEHCG